MNVFTFSATNGIVENSLRILDLCRTHDTDSTNPWGSIKPRLRTTALEQYMQDQNKQGEKITLFNMTRQYNIKISTKI